VGRGQFLKITTHSVYSASGDDGTYLEGESADMYIPADADQDWVWVRPGGKVVQTFGPGSKKQAAEDFAQPRATEMVRAAKGAFYNGRPMNFGLDSLPRDPQQLLNYIYRTTVGQGVSPDGEAVVFIADTLRTGVVPADLRAVLYKALAGIPGVSITADQVTLDGRSGVGFGRSESNGIRQEIIIDPATGTMIGERFIVTRAGVLPGVPAGTVEGSTSVSTTVVNAEPAGGTLCGSPGSKPVGGAGSGQCQG
jgi:RNA polymerase sigma-70 factor (ECF subfamily)